MSRYRDAGVDVAAGEALVEAIGADVTSTWTDLVVGGFGGFAAGIELPDGYRRPVLMMSTDGVGTKIELAVAAGHIDGLGFDLVAMCVDDLAAVGALPLGFTDYLAVGRIDAERDRRLVASIAAACRQAGCALLGGETAEHPGVMDPGRFDLAGAALGVVDRDAVVDGSNIAPGDVAIAVASPNLRSNGFSLVRSVVDRAMLDRPWPDDPTRTIGQVLVEPSVIYAPAMHRVASAGLATGFAHVTGGGLPGNAARPLPEGLGVTFDRSSWRPPRVFSWLAEIGAIDDDDMAATFNLGVGYVIYSRPDHVGDVAALLAEAGHPSWVAGRVTDGHLGVHFDGTATSGNHG